MLVPTVLQPESAVSHASSPARSYANQLDEFFCAVRRPIGARCRSALVAASQRRGLAVV